MAHGFPALKRARLLRVLEGLGYEVARQRGSHVYLVAPGRPPLVFAFHKGAEISSNMVRDILVRQVGLSIDEAREAANGR